MVTTDTEWRMETGHSNSDTEWRIETHHNNTDSTYSSSMEKGHNNNNVTDNSTEMVVPGDHVLDRSDGHSTEDTEQSVHREAAGDSFVDEKTGKDIDDGHLIQIKATNSEVRTHISYRLMQQTWNTHSIYIKQQTCEFGMC